MDICRILKTVQVNTHSKNKNTNSPITKIPSQPDIEMLQYKDAKIKTKCVQKNPIIHSK